MKPVVVDNTAKNSTKGKLAVQSYTLRKVKKEHKYKCRICQEVCDSAHLLTIHHQVKHGILYCTTVQKPSITRHHYQHKELKYVCTCGARFAFESQLQTHLIVHRKILEHHCVYPKCKKLFKNKGDLLCHAEEHRKPNHQCPDCMYSNSDIKNLESHRRKHNNITPYHCDRCGEDFKYNIQYRRHISSKTRIMCTGFQDLKLTGVLKFAGITRGNTWFII